MRILLKHLSFVVSALLFIQFSFSQTKIEQALERLNNNYSQEKIYLQFTKDFYVSGETAWFKAIVLEGYQKSMISTSIHVELYNEQKQIITKLFLPVLDGEAQGNINLPDSLPEAVYYIRAYTEWMLNFDPSFQCILPMRIYNPASAMQLVAEKISLYTAAAFPESGNFIEGINTKIAVRLYGNGSLPGTWSGYLIDKSKPAEKITSFESLDPNIGFFYLIPEKGLQYQVIIEDAGGKRLEADLPVVRSTGIHLQVNLGKGIVHYALRYPNPPAAAIPCTVIGTVNNILVYKANAVLTASGISATIPTKDMENGVLQLTIFDETYHVLASRLCFIDAANLKTKLPAVSAPDFNASARGANSITILPDTSFDHYSLLVTEYDLNAPDPDHDFYSQLWLSTDLPQNRIFRPASFFRKGNNPAALDALLITEKWQRFQWEDVLNDRFPVINYKPMPFIGYQGIVTVNNQPAGNIDMNLIFKFPDSSTQFQLVQTDANGKFNMAGLLFEDAISVYYQVNNKNINKKNLKVSFTSLNKNNEYRSSFPASGYQLKTRDRAVATDPEISRAILARDSYLSAQSKIKSLETVVVKGIKKTPTDLLNEKLSTPMFRRNNEMVFDLVNDNKTAQNYQNIMQFLNGRVPGLQVIRQGADWVPIVRGRPASIYLDEMLVDIDMVSNIPVSTIALVKVTRGIFAGTSGSDAQAGSGVVLIYTHRDGTRPPNPNSTTGLNSIKLEGFTKVQEFPLPDYSNQLQQPAGKDTRTVLYWNPFWVNESNTAESLKFFNNDDLKKIKVAIIGFSKSETMPAYYSQIIP